MVHMRSHSGLLMSLFLLTACGSQVEPSQTASAERPASFYTCGKAPKCDSPLPALAPAKGFRGFKPLGNPFHRGHDLFLTEGEEQWVIGKFTYGNLLLRGDLKDENVDIYLSRGCELGWEKLGSVRTSTREGQNPTVEGVEDKGGQIYFKIPADKTLQPGRHRLRLVVTGDNSGADLFIEVLPRGTKLFVSDVDGTLTTSEIEEAGKAVFGNQIPDSNTFVAEAFQSLVAKGYRPYYLTARPEVSVQRTRDFLDVRGFPDGIITTTQERLIGLNGERGIAYKTEALQRLKERGFDVVYAFGNTDTDAGAFANAGIPVNQRYFYRYTDDFGGRRLETYAQLDNFDSLASVCEAETVARL